MSSALDPEAREFIPSAIQQKHRDFPSLTGEVAPKAARNHHRKKHNSLNFKKAVNEKPKGVLTPINPLPFPVDPSWVVLTSQTETETPPREKIISLSTDPQNVDKFSVRVRENDKINHGIESKLFHEKPSIGAIDRWKLKWMEVARAARERLQSQRILVVEALKPNAHHLKTEGSWHNILSPSAHLDNMAMAPLPPPSLLIERVDKIAVSPHLQDQNETSHCLRSPNDWLLAIQNGEISKLASVMNKIRDSDWKALMLRVPLSPIVKSDKSKDIKMGPLHVAVFYRQSSCVRLFIDAGETPLHLL
jgi:hypothetical protein